MFSFRAHSAMYFVRCAAFGTFIKQARTSIKNISFTKKLYSDSNLNSVKPKKAKKSNTLNDKKLEPSKLYPDEWEKLSNYDVVKHFEFMDDDEKESSVQESSKLDDPKNIKSTSEDVKEGDIFPVVNGENLAPDMAEKVSDSDDSDGDIENRENNVTYFDDYKSKKEFISSKTNFHDLNINKLPRKSQYLRSMLDPKMLSANGIVAIDDYDGIYYLARNGVLPKTIFFLTPKILSFFPSSLTDVDLYKISNHDLKYWAPSITPSGTNIIALYQKEDLKLDRSSEEPQFPITIVCIGFKDGVLLGTIMYTASVGSCKLFLTTDAISPWDSSVLRSSWFSSFSLDHEFNLSWKEISERIPENEKILLIPWGATAGFTTKWNDIEIKHIPSVDLYDPNIWDGESMTLIAGVPHFRNSYGFLEFCRVRKVNKINLGLNKKVLPSASFGMVFFELRRQWLAKKNGNISGRQSDNEKTSKVRVEIVSTLFNI